MSDIIPLGTTENPDGTPEKPARPTSLLTEGLSYFSTAFGRILAGISSSSSSNKQVVAEELVTRRNLLLGLTALAATGCSVDKVGNLMLDREDSAELTTDYPLYPEALAEGKILLESIYKKLRAKKSTKLLASEKKRLTNWSTTQRVRALKPLFKKAFGSEWESYLTPGKSGSLPALPATFFETEGEKQEEYLRNALASGDTVEIEDESPSQPFFCQQVGRSTGTKNNHDSMYVHKEMLPTMGTLIALVNDQIDEFNADPGAFGVTEEGFHLPHVVSVKASGAHRNVAARHKGSTESFSDHWTDTALDIISEGDTYGAKVCRFKEALVYQGDTILPEGGYLPAQGEPSLHRDIVVTMIERALFVLEDALKKLPGHPKLMSRYEPGIAKNWHIALVPSNIADLS